MVSGKAVVGLVGWGIWMAGRGLGDVVGGKRLVRGDGVLVGKENEKWFS